MTGEHTDIAAPVAPPAADPAEPVAPPAADPAAPAASPAADPSASPRAALQLTRQGSFGDAVEVSEAELESVRRLLWDLDAPEDDRKRWHRQGFNFCGASGINAAGPSFGLQQGDGGPCGVLAAVQAELLRCLLFGASADDEGEGRLEPAPGTKEAAGAAGAAGAAAGAATVDAAAGTAAAVAGLPQPSEAEVQILLGEALLTILRRARPDGDAQPLCIVTCAASPCCLEARPSPFDVLGPSDAPPTVQTPAGDFAVVKFPCGGSGGGGGADRLDEARAYLSSLLDQFQAPSGVLLFLASVVLTRGVAGCRGDMDDPTAPLIGQFGHCGQELVNLLLTGRATSNVFDGAVPMGDGGLTLRGVARRSGVGYLTHLEALRYCQVRRHVP